MGYLTLYSSKIAVWQPHSPFSDTAIFFLAASPIFIFGDLELKLCNFDVDLKLESKPQCDFVNSTCKCEEIAQFEHIKYMGKIEETNNGKTYFEIK